MKLAFALALGLLTTSCVDPPADDSTDQTTQAASQGDCLGNFGATAPLPLHTAWTGSLPAVASSQEVWVMMPRDQSGATWGLYQVDLIKRRVSRAIAFTNTSRPAVMQQLGGRVQPSGGVRIPPPGGGGPIGDDWRQANFIINTGARIYYAPDNGLFATPP